MEKDCYNQIKGQEEAAYEEHKNNTKQELVIEKNLHDKAREKFNIHMIGKEEQGEGEGEQDYLQAYLEKYNLVGNFISYIIHLISY